MTQSIGQRLKAAREEQKLTLEKAFEATRIRVPYLQALEADDFTSVPSPVQARGYLRNYAEYLGLDFQQLLDELREASAHKPLGEVIGPADEAEADAGSATKPDASVERTEPATAALEPAPEEQPPVEETPLAPGIKPLRRKKTPPASEDAVTESTTKRRVRKKPQPEPEPVPAPEPQPMIGPESASMDGVPDEPAVMEEPAVEDVPAAAEETPSQINGEDRRWQSWLNRVRSVILTRMKRRTLVPKNETGLDEVVTPAPVVLKPESPSIEAPDARTEASSEIFREIGKQLRERRELLSLHLDEVERNTHVKAHYLSALEKGAMDELPSTVQTRGMLSNYATFLDMDVDALLLRFADALQTRYRERNPDKPGRLRERPMIESLPPMRSFVAGDIVFGIGMAVLLVGFAIWGVSRVVELQAQEAVQPTAPSISDVLLASPDPADVQATETLQPVESFPGLATVTIVIPTQDLNVDVQLNLVAVERTYMKVEVDGEVAFEGRVVPGNAYPFQGESQIEVLVGSGAAIRAVYNGRDLGLLGTFGQIVTYIYTADQIVTPTALPSPSPTNTQPPTATVPPTSTPVPTNTPVPSRTPAP